MQCIGAGRQKNESVSVYGRNIRDLTSILSLLWAYNLIERLQLARSVKCIQQMLSARHGNNVEFTRGEFMDDGLG